MSRLIDCRLVHCGGLLGRQAVLSLLCLHLVKCIEETAGSNNEKHLNWGGEFQIGVFGGSYTGVDTLLRTVNRDAPAGMDIHIVLDNLSTRKTTVVNQWLLMHPRFHSHFVPSATSWLNQLERWFKQLTDKRIRRGTFRSEAELCHALYAHIDVWYASAQPFKRSATEDSILGKIARIKLRQYPAVTWHYLVLEILKLG